MPAHLPRVERHHEPDTTICTTPGCGCTLKRIGEDVSEKLDYVPGVFTVERHIRGKWACAKCQTLTQAPVPAQIIDKGIATSGLLAQVLVAKYADHLPLYRQENIFARAGMAIARSTLAQWVGVCGVRLQPLVPGTLTLAKLDLVIQTAMGWTNSHLHEFVIDGRRYGMPDDEWPLDEPVLEDKRYKLDNVLGGVKEFTYTYDFGDNWLHIVTVEQVLLANEMNSWPMCLDGRNACPPEDVGGMGGYEEFLAALRDPTHDEHQVMWRWAGGPFDPNGFDRNAVNAAMRKLKI